MQKVFMPDADPETRLLLLQQNADEIEETTYLKPLTPEEMDAKREFLTDHAILISEYEDEKKELLADLKAKIDPLVKANKRLLQQIKSRHAEITGKIYHLNNFEDSTRESFNEAGELIGLRRLRPDEKQQNIFNLKKAN